MILTFLHVATIISITLGQQGEAPVTDIGRLKSDLLKNYDSSKPAKDTIVYLLFVPTFMQPNEAEEVLLITGQIFVYWHDSRLIWTPESYNGVKTFRFSGADSQNKGQVWTPKIVATTVDGFDYRLVRLHLSMLQVHSYGLVEVQLNWGDQISCAYDRASFPYDLHNCSVSFHKTSPFLRSNDEYQFELRSGSITEASIQYQHTVAMYPITSNGFDLAEFTQDTWYHNFAFRNGSNERPDETIRRRFLIIEFVQLKATLKRRVPWFAALFKMPLIGLLFVTTAAMCSSTKNFALFVLTTNILLHAFIINSFLSIAPSGISLPNYGWLAGTSLLINCLALAYRLTPETFYNKTSTSSAVICIVTCVLIMFAVMFFS